MNARRRSFIRKIIYLLCLLPLPGILYWLGHPATLPTETTEGTRGGVLAQQRQEEGLAQMYLGKIDPASVTLKLATLGMNGIAANVLWTKQIEYQKKKDWTNVSATLDQIVRLQPNFIDVWRHQGWNLSYNCSAEFDDYHERYRWVIKGIRFLQEGTTYNQLEPRLLRDIGWYTSQKIGRSDEHVQFRRLFREDDDFNGALPKSRRDNWLVGKTWFRKAENLIDTENVPTRGMNPVVFRSEGPMCQMNYGVSMEQEGVFGEKARQAWREALKDWDEFGRFSIPASDGQIIHLGELERLERDRQNLVEELDGLAPGVREKLHKDRYERLTDDQRKALETPQQQRTEAQVGPAAEAAALLVIEPQEVARNRGVPAANREAANKVLGRIEQLDNRIRRTRSYRGVVNYEYWQRRAEIEQKNEMLTARELVFQGGKSLAEGDSAGAQEAFALGSAHWANVLRQHRMLIDDSATGDDLEELIEAYGKVLDQRDELFPDDFPLHFYVRRLVLSDAKSYQIAHSLRKAAEAEKAGDWGQAVTFYTQALQNWQQLLVGDIPRLEQRSDPLSCFEILATVERYANAMKRLKRPIADDFGLHPFMRIQMEHDPEAREAQGAIEKGEDAAARGDLAAARKAYDEGFALWRKVIDRYPTTVADGTLREEWMAVIDEYRDLLKRQGEELPKDFPLQDVVDRAGRR